MSVWQSAFIDSNGLRVHYTRTGGDKPSLVLAHGVTDDGLCWSPLANVLEADYDVIMVDARGHGLSEAPLTGYTPLEQADDLAGVIQALNLKQPIVLGHSMGAATTLVLAARYPQLPCAIALEDPPPWWDPTYDRPNNSAWQAMMRAWLVPLKQQSRQAILEAQRLAEPGWSDAEVEPWVDSKLHFSLNFFNDLSDPDLNWSAIVRQVHCPTLLITGDVAAGALVSEQAAQLFQQLMPQVQVAHISEAGHSIRRDQFERYRQVLRPFLAEISRSSSK